MNYSIRIANREDMLQVLDLIKALAIFEKEANAVEVTVKDLQSDGFGDNPAFKCFVAEVNYKIEGIALIYNRYSTWKGKIIHLEDLIVNEKHRGLGIGTALLDEVVKYADSINAKRINWEVIDWNDSAITFYESKGANVMRDWDVVQLNEQAIKDYITKLKL